MGEEKAIAEGEKKKKNKKNKRKEHNEIYEHAIR
jgi:hypothetical protein